ncbi:AMIN domain-containing protein [Synechococcus sp. PCC 6312]|uniref:AMIN domain-containing protein n=1 Tax=Synechococcus sp. (strain ATCC 27167 / PCC 6312) TaxID=195253 RepID=UPI00029ED1A6|nr:AMIN domain-containing protein [Synechococcus sp. PCC 6312]AFY60588.1 type II secretory pathway, component PulD [Synechococcus sp. PCC 6312]
MNQSQALQRIGVSCLTASLLLPLAQPAAFGADTEITGIKLNSTPNGIQVVFNVQGNLRPPVFTVNRGNASIADISNSQLRLPQGGAFRQDNPAPGITSLEVAQLDPKTIRITVNGVASAPSSQVVRKPDGSGLLLNFITAQKPAGPATPPISGQPANTFPGPNPVPPLQARAVAPPVGDIVIAPVLSDPDVIDLGTSERIPRLLLREAPVREVLGLLARAAGANIAYSEDSGGPGAGPQTISLDIENESVQDVFNYVIRVAGLQANRQGRTIFVGSQLPPEAQNRIVRTIRLNQMWATIQTQTVQTLTSQANTGGSVGAIAGSASSGTTAGTSTPVQTSINRQTQITDNINQLGALELLQSYGANQGATTPQGSQFQSTLLAGLSVIADARTNSVTLIGTPRKVEMAMSIISQLDVRKRQAMVNVKFVDVNLLKGRVFNTNIQTNFGDSLTAAIFDPNGLSVSSGTQPPGQSPPVVIPPDRENTTAIIFPPIAIPGLPVGQTVSNFFANIILQVQTGNVTILTNPTLVIQEGSAAQVNLTQEVFSGITSTASTTGTGSGAAVAATSITPIIRQAGVIFNVTIDQIDDNGFITMQLSPEVSAPSGTYSVVFPGVSLPSTGTLLSQRRMESGRIRLRDGQTLVLAGIIQDQDRSTVTKIPILGDLPILGRLFRQESSTRDRRELVVMVTPKVMDDSQNATNGYIYSPGQGISPQMQQQILTPPRRY